MPTGAKKNEGEGRQSTTSSGKAGECKKGTKKENAWRDSDHYDRDIFEFANLNLNLKARSCERAPTSNYLV